MRYISSCCSISNFFSSSSIFFSGLRLAVGGGGGGLNFDAKLRRSLTDPEDLFIGHISSMDTLARGLITEAGTDADSGAVTFTTTELFLERLGLSSLADLPDIAPLLPDVDVIDDLSETLSEEPRFMKLNGAPAVPTEASFDVDKE